MNLCAIDHGATRDALRRLRLGAGMAGNALLEMTALARRLEAAGLEDSETGREWQLAALLEELTDAQLRRLGGPADGLERFGPGAAEGLDVLRAVLREGSPEHQAWAYLAYRHFLPDSPSVSDLAERLNVSQRTLQRRQERAERALARMLREEERSALAASGEMAAGASIEATTAGALPDPERWAPRGAAAKDPGSLEAYWLQRYAAWSGPEHGLHERFVPLSLTIEASPGVGPVPPTPATERYESLAALLAGRPEQAVVLLGPPGAGKTTLLRRFEVEVAHAMLRRAESGPSDGEPAPVLTFHASLGLYAPDRDGGEPPPPLEWLDALWRRRYAAMPSLADLMGSLQVVLLLDGVNEMPAATPAEHQARIHAWKEALARLRAERPATRAVFACRWLDYTVPLSTKDLHVPQAIVEPLSDEGAERLVAAYAPRKREAVWRRVSEGPMLQAFRLPYLLALYAAEAEANGGPIEDRAELFTAFVRRALARELARDNPLFAAGRLLATRDCLRLTHWRWSGPYDLPERGPLVPALARLAHGMQARADAGAQARPRADLREALALLDDAPAEEVLRAAGAMGVLEEDLEAEAVAFAHQLLQEFFAARHVVATGELPLPAATWRAVGMPVPLPETIAALGPAEPLPPPPASGWEETCRLAALMSEEPFRLVARITPDDLVLAGRCAAQARVRDRLPDALLTELTARLLERGQDPEADLRARIAAARALGDLGDPRFPITEGPLGPFVVPDMVPIPGGEAVIGHDEPVEDVGVDWTGHMPRHSVAVEPFLMARYPVTNAEFGCFVRAGGYEDDRWWATAAARAWRAGHATRYTTHDDLWRLRRDFVSHPEQLEAHRASGRLTADLYEKWLERLAMDEAAFAAYVAETFPDVPFREPRHWHDRRFNGPNQPVVGIGWFEAGAYCAWLSAQTRLPFRLPTEVEWERAARGPSGRQFAYGDDLDPWRSNVGPTHVRHTTPVGVFPGGDTPDGLVDMSGNVAEWTSSAFGRDGVVPVYPYPYDPSDGREDPDLPLGITRVLRGGSWNNPPFTTRTWWRLAGYPDAGTFGHGMRVALTLEP